MNYKLLVFVLGMALAGCREEPDVERPVAQIDAPVSGGIVTTDDGIEFMATLTDNNGLLQYKLTLNGIDSLNDIAADSTLSLIFIEGVPDESNSYTVAETIFLSDTTFNGQYQITLECIDSEGNQSFRDTVSFTIKNSIDSEPPQLNVGGPSLDTMTLGNGFSPYGEITDDRALSYATIYIGTVNGSDTIHWFDFPNIQNNLVSFETGQTFWVVDSSWTEGSYHMYCTAWDEHSGVSKSIPFQVSY